MSDQRKQPEHDDQRHEIACGKNRHRRGGQHRAGDDPRGAAAQRAVRMVGSDGNPRVHQERQQRADDAEQRQIGDAVGAGKTADGLRNEHRVERGHRRGEQQRTKREAGGETMHLRFGGRGAVGRGHRIAQVKERRFEVRHSGVEMGERGQRGAAFRVDEGLLHFRTLVGSLGHARILLYGQALQGRFGLFGQRFFVIGTVIDTGAHEHLARQRLRLHWSLLLTCIMLIIFSHLLFLFLFFLFCIVASRSCFYFVARFEMSHDIQHI